jgi:hypothetical protein
MLTLFSLLLLPYFRILPTLASPRAFRLISSVSFAYAREYVKELLTPVIESMVESPGVSYEINPVFIAERENMGENRSALRSLVNNIVTRIIGSASNVPEPLLLMWHILATETSKKTPDIAQTQETLNRFIFGRFWGPAIACPQAYGICEGRLPPSVNRGLVLASKILQVRAPVSCEHIL